jgi:2-polyprenyl-3-methyl-5-hydroxy-6-metoxy-1,4-benzoquinol methylase
MITAAAMKPLGLAIKDFYAGDVAAEVQMHRDDGVVSVMAISAFFRGPLDFQVDKLLLERCSGTVLDIGAGAGIHSLYLQEKGLDVTALDVSPEACKVMQHRGVNNVVCSSIANFTGGPFDTLLILGRSIGFVETLEGLAGFLRDIHRLVKPGGRILLNSLDVSQTRDTQNLSYQDANRRAGKYIGEIKLYMEYRGVTGPELVLLHVDPVTLASHAAGAGWACRVLLQEKDGHYAAVLERQD